MKLTPWFDAKTKPVHPGIYKTNATNGESYQFWTGSYWGLQGCKDDFWPFMSDIALNESRYQSVNWRGLANPPKQSKGEE